MGGTIIEEQVILQQFYFEQANANKRHFIHLSRTVI